MKVRSVIALPFRIDGIEAGVVFLRTLEGEPSLKVSDVDFADDVVKAAVSAIQRAQAMESTRADNERLEVLALTDSLTQTLNRRALMDRLDSELDRARRYSLTLSLLMVDLDHFKIVNDSFGHLAGDEALRGVARVLQREARSVDVVARYGGEEFVVILPETGEDGAVKVAERIRARVAEQAIRGTAANAGAHRERGCRNGAVDADSGAGRAHRARGRRAVPREGAGPQSGVHMMPE